MKILLKIFIIIFYAILSWLYLTLYMLLIACIAIIDDKISYRSIPYLILPLLLGASVLFYLEKVNKKYKFKRKIKIYLLIIGFLFIPLIYLSIKSPLAENNTLILTKNAEESYNEFQKLAKIKLDCSFTNIPFSAFKSNILNYADLMEAAWTNNIQARNLINKLNSFDKIFNLSYERDGSENELYSLLVLSKLYSRYAMLKAEQNDYELAANILLSMNTLFMKSYHYAGGLIRLTLCAIDYRTIKAMNFLTERTNCPSEVVAKIQKSLFEIKLDIRQCLIYEKNIYKRKLEEYITLLSNIYSSPMNFSLKVSTYLLTDKNKFCKDEDAALNVFFSCATNQPSDFSVFNKYMKKYKSRIPIDNVIGWVIISAYNSTLPKIYKTVFKQIRKRNKIVKEIKTSKNICNTKTSG